MSAEVRPSPLACLQCRSKHLKCDARQPVCSRCATHGIQCLFVRSQRGLRGRGRRATPLQNGHRQTVDVNQDRSMLAVSPTPGTDSISASTPESTFDDDALVRSYYDHFHSAHPFLAPQNATTNGLIQLPSHLRESMAYVASHYTRSNKASLSSGLPDLGHISNDLYKVQSLLLYAVACFARLECEEGQVSLERALTSARRLGMERESYVLTQPAVLHETCRRTWWELYVIATLVKSILNVHVSVSLDGVDLKLPGEDNPYEQCQPSPPQPTLQAMQNRFFSDTDHNWSSYAYKVEATRILATVLATEEAARASGGQANFETCQAAISSWWLSLPPDKRQAESAGGHVDETMFTALMIINMASLRMNLPRSDLSWTFRSATVCTNIDATISSRDAVYHTATALNAANGLSSLIASESALRPHTPCSACAIAFGTIVQLPAYLREANAQKSENLKANIELGLSYLKRMGETWPLAMEVRRQLAALARDVLSSPTKRDSAMSQEQADLPAQPTTQAITTGASAAPAEQWIDFARQSLVGSSTATPFQSQQGHLMLDGGDAWLQELIEAPSGWLGDDMSLGFANVAQGDQY